VGESGATGLDLVHGSGKRHPEEGRSTVGGAIDRGYARVLGEMAQHVDIVGQHLPCRGLPTDQSRDAREDVEGAIGLPRSRCTMRSLRVWKRRAASVTQSCGPSSATIAAAWLTALAQVVL